MARLHQLPQQWSLNSQHCLVVSLTRQCFRLEAWTLLDKSSCRLCHITLEVFVFECCVQSRLRGQPRQHSRGTWTKS